MRLERIRIAAQVASFGLLTYGGRIGIKLGHFLPCFACPYVGGCAGHCYLMALQGPIWGLQIPLPMLIGAFGLGALGMFAGFAALTILLSKTWCGWICPFGTLQDWLTSLRRRLAIRESRIPWGIMDRLKLVKYLLLLLLLLIPALIANASLHPDLRLPFCQICPAKPLMPLFEGNTSHLALNLSNPITIGMSALSVALAGGFLVGTFFKDRFFCVFCPMLALISVFDRIGLLRLKKNAASCLGCGNCQRVCPVDIREVHDEKNRENVLAPACMECLKCVDACPQEGTLSLRLLRWRLFASSRMNALKSLIKGKA